MTRRTMPTPAPIFTTPTWTGVAPLSRNIRTLRGDNEPLAKALHEIPGFTDANAALHAFAKEAAALTADPAPSAEDRAAALAARFLAGERPDADMLRREIAHDAAEALAADGARAVVSGVGMRLLHERDEITSTGHDDIAASLTRQFRAVIDKARTAGVTTATLDSADVLRREAMAEGKALDEATVAYVAIRAGATALLSDYRVASGSTDPNPVDFWTAITLADPLGVDRWHPAASGPYQVRNRGTGEIIAESTLPDFATAEPREIVAWLAEHDEAEVWVPTGPQASKAVQAITKARMEAGAAASRRIPLTVLRNPFGDVYGVKWQATRPGVAIVVPATGDAADDDVWIVERKPEVLIVGA